MEKTQRNWKSNPIIRMIYAPGKRIRRLPLRFLRRLQRSRKLRSVARGLMKRHIKFYAISDEDSTALFHLRSYGKALNGEDSVKAFIGTVERMKCKGYILTAELFGRLIGVITLVKHPDNPDYRHWWLYSFLVHEHYRGLGVGKTLLQMALQKAVSQNAEQVNAYVIKEDKRAVSLYCSMGFKCIADSETDAGLGKYGFYQFIPKHP